MKKFSLFLLFISCSIILYSQEKKDMIDLLTSKKWHMQGMVGKTSSTQYSRTKEHAYFNGQLIGVLDYYLSDSIDKKFDPKKIGLANNGKYIVTKKSNTVTDTFSVFEIISISKDYLEIRFIEHTHTLKYE
jgi:hypothetical protein